MWFWCVHVRYTHFQTPPVALCGRFKCATQSDLSILPNLSGASVCPVMFWGKVKSERLWKVNSDFLSETLLTKRRFCCKVYDYERKAVFVALLQATRLGRCTVLSVTPWTSISTTESPNTSSRISPSPRSPTWFWRKPRCVRTVISPLDSNPLVPADSFFRIVCSCSNCAGFFGKRLNVSKFCSDCAGFQMSQFELVGYHCLFVFSVRLCQVIPTIFEFWGPVHTGRESRFVWQLALCENTNWQKNTHSTWVHGFFATCAKQCRILCIRQRHAYLQIILNLLPEKKEKEIS